MKIKPLSLKTRVLIYPAIFILVPSIFIGYFSIVVTRNMVVNKVTKLNTQLLSQLQYDIDRELASVERGVSSLLTNRKIQEIMYTDYSKNPNGKSEGYFFITDNLKNIVNSRQDIVDAIGIYGYNTENIVILGGIYYDSAFIDSEWFMKTIENRGRFSYEAPSFEDKPYLRKEWPFIPASRVFIDPATNRVTMAVRVFFRVETLTKLIQNALYGKNSEVAIVDSKSRVIALAKESVDETGEKRINSIKDLENLKLLNKEVLGVIASKVKEKKENNATSINGYMTIKIDGEKKLISYAASDVNDWITMSVIPLGNLLAEVMQIIQVIVIVATVSAVTGISLSGLFFYKIATKPINKIIKYVKQLEIGDFTEDITMDRKDELKVVGDALNNTVDRLRGVLKEMDNGREIILKSSQDISRESETVAQNSISEATSIEETSSTVKEISSLVIATLEKTKEANELTQNTVENVKITGGHSVNLKNSMDAITKSSNNIKKIISVIDEIAFQTNLLAINASVEAARAGEAGRGFSVVAYEIRNLALKSREAATSIKELIEESEVCVLEGGDYVEDTLNSIDRIVEEVNKVAQIISNIAESADEQEKGINQVHKLISDLDNISQKNSEMAQKNFAIADSLKKEANAFSKIFNFFKF